MIETRRESPRNPQAAALLQSARAFMDSLYPPEENFALSADDLDKPGVQFFVASDGPKIIGTVALVERPDHAEVKSMFVDPSARGKGAAQALLRRVEREARRLHVPALMLETGPLNTEAMALYTGFGFTRRGPFGNYADLPSSVFMELPLKPHRMTAQEPKMPVLNLLRDAFAFMDGRIDPPSSLRTINEQALQVEASNQRLWVLGARPLACMILTPKPDTLYLGKLAVQADARGRGLARVMIESALGQARVLGLSSVTLQTRVELTENQTVFTTMGFVETERTAHAGYDRPTSITYVHRV